MMCSKIIVYGFQILNHSLASSESQPINTRGSNFIHTGPPFFPSNTLKNQTSGALLRIGLHSSGHPWPPQLETSMAEKSCSPILKRVPAIDIL